MTAYSLLSSILAGVIQSVGRNYSVDISVITTKNNISTLVRKYIETGEYPTFDGWRGDLLNEAMKKFIKGELHMRYSESKGIVEVVNSNE